MFLGLDRRAVLTEDVTATQAARARIISRRGKNIFNASLGQSVVDAATLAEAKVRDALIAVGRIGEDLRKDLLLELLSVETTTGGHFALAMPTKAEMGKIVAIRRDVQAISKILSLEEKEVTGRVIPFVDQLESFAQRLPRNVKLGDFMASVERNDNRFTALLNWSFNRPQLKRIQLVSKLVASYNSGRKELERTTQNYLTLINNFLRDSGKALKVDESGYISVSVEGVADEKPIAWLSSGEAQIFVILTHLTFNSAAQAANVFIIDEPELSLHVQWQELFVESVLSANPGIQYIMATHSPSIILERTNRCIEVNGRKGK
jgi:hypothetical protein